MVMLKLSKLPITNMGRKAVLYKRKQEREKQRIREIEKSLGINQPVTMCPKCGTPMELKKVPQKQNRGVLGEGGTGGIYLIEPSSNSSLKVAQNTPALICPKCQYRILKY
jgi:hypothetical protein